MFWVGFAGVVSDSESLEAIMSEEGRQLCEKEEPAEHGAEEEVDGEASEGTEEPGDARLPLSLGTGAALRFGAPELLEALWEGKRREEPEHSSDGE